MVFRYYDIDDRVVSERIKPSNPRPDRDGKLIKYESPIGSGSYPYLPKLIREKMRRREKVQAAYHYRGRKKDTCPCGRWLRRRRSPRRLEISPQWQAMSNS